MTAVAFETRLGELEAAFGGQLVRPTDSDYDGHRAIWNGSIDRRPELIARCTGTHDVLAALRFAREAGLAIAVRSGGHSFPGHSVADEAMVIDLGSMRGIRVDPQRRIASVQAGARLGDVDRETQAFGLALPAGIVTTTGVAGLTLGGGIGWVMRKHGLTIDNLRSVDLVTADGEFLQASETENANLFWGVRGGGGNFGIVTAFEFDLVPLGPTVLAGPIFWRMEDSPEVLRFYRDWIAEAPDDLMTIVVHRYAPAAPFVPEELHGEPVVAVACCWAGAIEDGEQVIRPMKEFGSPVLDLCVPKPFRAHQAMFDSGFPPGWWYYVRSCDVAELTDDVLDTTVEFANRLPSLQTGFPIWQMGGGAISRQPDGESAFNGRSAGFTFNITAVTEGPDGFDAAADWARSFWSALVPHHTTVYVNFLMEEGEDRVRDAYGAERYDRLKALKRRYDPDNVFRLNQNIRPD